MTSASLARFLAGLAIAALAAHVATAIIVVIGLHAVYPHRIFNVRRWSDQPVENYRLVGTYLKENAKPGRPLTVFAGSSVTYGDVWPANVTFPSLFAERRPSSTVLNASIIAGDVSAINDWIVCGARRNEIHINTLIIELPVVNTLNQLINYRHNAGGTPPLSACETSDPDPGYIRLAVTTLRGTGWFRLLWNGQRELKDERQLQLGAVPKGYFASAEDFTAVQPLFARQIAETLARAQTIAADVYAFPSPVFLLGLASVGEDAPAVRAQLAATLAACRAVPGVRCIDPSGLYAEPSYYANLTHMNHAGHRAMAGLLDGQVAH